MTNIEAYEHDIAENLGEGTVLVRQRMAQIGREATKRVQEEMAHLGQTTAETKEQGSVGKAEDMEKGRRSKPQGSYLENDRARSVNVPGEDLRTTLSNTMFIKGMFSCSIFNGAISLVDVRLSLLDCTKS